MYDNELWFAYKTGDVKALEGLYEKYYAPLMNYGFKFIPDKFCIEESIQELFRKLWRNRDHVMPCTAVKQYLYMSYRRILLRKLDDGPLAHEEGFSSEQIPFHLDLKYRHPLVQAERLRELSEKVSALYDSLTYRQREAIFLRYVEDLSQEQTANIMHIHTSVAQNLLHAAFELLRNQLGGFRLKLLLYLLKCT